MFVWVYVLVSDNGKYYTVGAARNLKRCFEMYDYEHNDNCPRILVATYRLELEDVDFHELGAQHPDCKELEEMITLQCMKRLGSRWYRVISEMGRYNEHSALPEKLIDLQYPISCLCGVPAERRVSQTGRHYYTCPRKNRDWLRDMQFPHFILCEAHRKCSFFAWCDFYEKND